MGPQHAAAKITGTSFLTVLHSTLCYYPHPFALSDSATILTLYVSLVRPYLEYASPVWSPYTIGDIAQLERVQKFALRMAAHDWSANYQDLLDKFEIPSLERRRLDLSVSHLYKIVNNLCYFPSGLIQFRPHHVYNTRSSHFPILLQPFAHTNYYLKSFIPNTISLWNSLPANITNSSSLSNFKSKLINLTL